MIKHSWPSYSAVQADRTKYWMTTENVYNILCNEQTYYGHRLSLLELLSELKIMRTFKHLFLVSPGGCEDGPDL